MYVQSLFWDSISVWLTLLMIIATDWILTWDNTQIRKLGK